MALDPAQLRSLLQTQESDDLTARPLLTMVANDPANAAELVPHLGESGLAARNARRMLGAFGADAVPVVVATAATLSDARTRREALEIVWTLLVAEDELTVRRMIAAAGDGLRVLLDDRTSAPEDRPDHIEVDFHGRVCDYAYLLIQKLLDRSVDQSAFRSRDDVDRDADIRTLWLPDTIG